MSQSFDIDTTYNTLDKTVYDIFNVDAYCSSLSPPVTSPESVSNASAPASRVKRYPKARGHPWPSPAVIPPPSLSFVSAPAVAMTSSFPATIPAKPSKGKGCQHSAATAPPASPVDSPSSIATISTKLTPEQHLCFVQMLKRLDEWLTQGWQPGVNKSRLWTLAEIFNAAESVAEGSLSNIRHADLAWRLADSKGWEKSAGSSIMGAINIQVTITKILYKDYGELLITSFRYRKRLNWVTKDALQTYQDRLFRKKRVEEIQNQTYQRGFDSLAWTVHLEELVTYTQNGMKAADYLLMRWLPMFQCMMRHAGVSPTISPLLAERLSRNGSTFCSPSAMLPPEPTLFVPATLLVHSLTAHSPLSSSTTNYDTFSRVMDMSPTPTPSEDFDAFDVTPLDIGPTTMTEVVDQFMEDLLTQEFCPVMLTEELKGGG